MANEQFSEAFVLKEMRCNLGENEFGKVYPQGDVPEVSIIEKLLKKAGGKPKECDIDDYTQGPQPPRGCAKSQSRPCRC